jgi:alkylated DNA repair dioxygenase AlkB
VPAIEILARFAKDALGVECSYFLCNRYAGTDCIGKHADSERDLDPSQPILSFSFGETRTFRITSNDGRERWDVPLRHGDVVVMKPGMQAAYKHEILKLPVTGRVLRVRG